MRYKFSGPFYIAEMEIMDSGVHCMVRDANGVKVCVVKEGNDIGIGEVVELLNAGALYALHVQANTKTIIQPWAATLGLRHQGVLVSAIRGCDTEMKEGPGKWLTRFYRASVLRAHVGDPAKAASFMSWTESRAEFEAKAKRVLDSFDQMPNHWVMHMLQAAQVCGYYYPDPEKRSWWLWFYLKWVRKMHLYPESEEQMNERLNATEDEFGAMQAV